MGRPRAWRGRATQGNEPNWQPLLDAVGEDITGCFMWMFEVELSNGRLLQAYKHIDTRAYVHLGDDGAAFYYEEPDRYRSLPIADAFAAVFAGMIGLAGVTGDQVAASWAAVDRLRREGFRRSGGELAPPHVFRRCDERS